MQPRVRRFEATSDEVSKRLVRNQVAKECWAIARSTVLSRFFASGFDYTVTSPPGLVCFVNLGFCLRVWRWSLRKRELSSRYIDVTVLIATEAAILHSNIPKHIVPHTPLHRTRLPIFILNPARTSISAHTLHHQPKFFV